MTLTDWQVKFLIGATEYDMTAKCEWGVSIEETLGQPAVATFKLQDRAPTDLDPFSDVFTGPPGAQGVALERLDTKIEIAGATVPMFRGMVMTYTGALPVAYPWPTYEIHCTDYQTEVFDRRLVGVPNGYNWVGPDAQGNYTPVDPNAVASATDKATVVALLAAYNSFPVIDTSLVNDYGTDLTGGGYDLIHFDRTTIRGALEIVAGMVAGNYQYWIDSALRMHGVVLPRWYEQQTDPGSLSLGLPETLFPLEAAPANIDNDTPDGITSIGSRDLSWTFDYNPDTFDYWVNGGLGFAYNGGVADLKGSGWWPALPSGALPQAMLDAPSAVDAITKSAAATRARTSGQQGILRGKLVVGNERHHPDGWHVGQAFKLNDVRLPGYLNGRYYVIQRVTTTLVPGQNWRVYAIEWGDAPIARLSSRKAPGSSATATPPALPGRVWEAAYSEFTPLPSSVVTVVGQLTGDDGTPRRVANVSVSLEILTWDATNTLIAPVGSLSASVVTTDTMGRWTTDLTVGSQLGYSYEVRPKAGA